MPKTTNYLTDSEIKSLFAKLHADAKIVITSHQSPDGDAIGSSLGLYNVLKTITNQCTVIVPDGFPFFLKWMEDCDKIVQYDQQQDLANALLAEADIVFSLDYNHPSRISAMGEKLLASKAFKVLIDHHQMPDSFPDITLSDTSASSTSQLVYDFLNELGLADKITVGGAESLYSGIMTDTGSFRFNSTSAHTHHVAAQLMAIGVKPDEVYNRINDTNNYSKLQLLGFLLSEKLNYLPHYNAAFFSITVDEKQRFDYKKGDTEGVVNYGLSIEGVKISAMFIEEKDMVKVSLRSKGDVDVNMMARNWFNGGGHKNAAGGRLDISLNETISLYLDVLDKTFSTAQNAK